MTTRTDRENVIGPSSLFDGGGEMGARMRALDWSKTAVGPVETWPQSLKTAVRIMLTSRYAMWMGWGPEFTFFCNDAYLPTVGVKQSWVLGASARTVWAEIWNDIGPRADTVLERGVATWDEGLLLFLERSGFPEETYHTFSYSPLPDDQGGIGGMLCVVTEETERMLGERRLGLLRKLAAELAGTHTNAEVCAGLLRNFAAEPRDVPFTLTYLYEDEGRSARLLCATGVAEGCSIAPSIINVRAEASPWPAHEIFTHGAQILIDDLAARCGPLPTAPWDKPARQAVIVPLAKQGQVRPAGFLVLAINPYRPFDAAYQGFVDLLAGQIASALANAEAYEQERRRAEALTELDRAKTTFFSNVSHEFRTPLTLLLGPLEDALADETTTLSAAQRERVLTAHRNSLRLLKLVNTLLDFSRIEAGRMQAVYEPIELGAFTTDLASNFRSACERAGLKLVVDCPDLGEPVYVDRDMWEKVILNLLSNAFKFTLAGEIRVSLRRLGDRVELTVKDSGIGIAESEIPHLFERFHRVEGTRGRSLEGTGIGLALAQELVKLHEGSIEVESILEKGTTFRVKIPLGLAHLQAAQVRTPRSTGGTKSLSVAPYINETMRWIPQATSTAPGTSEIASHAGLLTPASPRSEGGRARILLADDNADMRDYVCGLLASQYEVQTVTDGQAALTAALAQPPDLILTDVMMPNLDGFGLLKALRADVRTAATPIILLSARAGEEARVEGHTAGADDYLIKPFSARELIARIRGSLALAQSRRQIIRREQELNAEKAAILESIQEGFVGLDEKWRFTYVNAQAERIYNMRREDLVGKDLWEVFPEVADTIFGKEYRRVMTERKTSRFEEYYEPFGGWFEVSVYPLIEGGIAVYFRDITERRQIEVALKEADRRKDEFLATLAHELRNPLAPIRNGLQLLRMTQDVAASERVYDMMERQVDHLVRLVDDLLELSRITRGKIDLRLEDVNLAMVLRSAIDTSRPLIDSAEHKLSVSFSSESLMVHADPVRLSQVFANLLNNAAKYTRRGGRISLTVQPHQHEVQIAVRDNGVGIPADMLPRVFELFTQVDRTQKQSQGGLGIGLALVKSLVGMHHGRVEAHSAGADQGSEFCVYLPLLEPPKDLGAAPVPSPQGKQPQLKLRILVIDDSHAAADSLSLMLEFLGSEVYTANDGPSGLAAIKQHQPNVVLLDIGMPGMDGYEVARRVRQDASLRNIVLIALTGWGQSEDRARSQQAGFDHHLVKPVDPTALQKLLTSIQAKS